MKPIDTISASQYLVILELRVKEATPWKHAAILSAQSVPELQISKYAWKNGVRLIFGSKESAHFLLRYEGEKLCIFTQILHFSWFGGVFCHFLAPLSQQPMHQFLWSKNQYYSVFHEDFEHCNVGTTELLTSSPTAPKFYVFIPYCNLLVAQKLLYIATNPWCLLGSDRLIFIPHEQVWSDLDSKCPRNYENAEKSSCNYFW